jgi:UDP-N-acetylglucosamine 2-epimerase
VLHALGDTYGQPIVVSTHPRTRKRIESMGLVAHPLVQFHKPFGFFDYVHLQINAHAVLSDSGTITEESSILNFPALNLREAHERPEGFEEGAVMLVGLNDERVMQAMALLQTQGRGNERSLRLVQDYSPQEVSAKVLRILVSYVDYVNRRVWRVQG